MEPKEFNILQRLNAVMGEISYVQKDKKEGMKYSVVSHDVVTAKVRLSLVKHGVVYYPAEMSSEQDGNRTQVKLVVRFVNIDDPSDFIDVHGLGYGIDTQDKGPGKAVSYAVKYCLLKALGLETGDDPDVENQEHKSAPKAAPATRTAATVVPQESDFTLEVETNLETAHEGGRFADVWTANAEEWKSKASPGEWLTIVKNKNRLKALETRQKERA